MARINTRQIATHGLGGVTSQDVWKVAFPEINFEEIFGEVAAGLAGQSHGTSNATGDLFAPYNLAGQSNGTSNAQGSLYVAFTGSASSSGGGAASPRRRRRDEDDERDAELRRRTRVRTYSILSEELLSGIQVRQITSIRSITSIPVVNSPTVTMGFNDDEEILMMLLAA